jgi:hypothetical protein
MTNTHLPALEAFFLRGMSEQQYFLSESGVGKMFGRIFCKKKKSPRKAYT